MVWQIAQITSFWQKHWSTNQTILIIALVAWLFGLTLFIYLSKYLLSLKLPFGIIWGILNISIALILDYQYIFSAVILLNAGFLFLFYVIFANKIRFKKVKDVRK